MVNITAAEGEQKMTDFTTFLSLSDVTQRFSPLPFLLKGCNSRVAQITTLHWRHRRKAGRQSKRREPDTAKSNNYSNESVSDEVWPFLFFSYCNDTEEESC